jgi:hypothetical protein
MRTTGFKALGEKLDWIAGPYSTDFGVILCRKKCTEAESLRTFTIQHYNPASCIWVKRSEFESFTRDMMDYIEELSEELGERASAAKYGRCRGTANVADGSNVVSGTSSHGAGSNAPTPPSV